MGQKEGRVVLLLITGSIHCLYSVLQPGATAKRCAIHQDLVEPDSWNPVETKARCACPTLCAVGRATGPWSRDCEFARARNHSCHMTVKISKIRLPAALCRDVHGFTVKSLKYPNLEMFNYMCFTLVDGSKRIIYCLSFYSTADVMQRILEGGYRPLPTG